MTAKNTHYNLTTNVTSEGSNIRISISIRGSGK